MTNDGEFANLIMHPSKHVPKLTGLRYGRIFPRSSWR